MRTTSLYQTPPPCTMHTFDDIELRAEYEARLRLSPGSLLEWGRVRLVGARPSRTRIQIAEQLLVSSLRSADPGALDTLLEILREVRWDRRAALEAARAHPGPVAIAWLESDLRDAVSLVALADGLEATEGPSGRVLALLHAALDALPPTSREARDLTLECIRVATELGTTAWAQALARPLRETASTPREAWILHGALLAAPGPYGRARAIVELGRVIDEGDPGTARLAVRALITYLEAQRDVSPVELDALRGISMRDPALCRLWDAALAAITAPAEARAARQRALSDHDRHRLARVQAVLSGNTAGPDWDDPTWPWLVAWAALRRGRVDEARPWLRTRLSEPGEPSPLGHAVLRAWLHTGEPVPRAWVRAWLADSGRAPAQGFHPLACALARRGEHELAVLAWSHAARRREPGAASHLEATCRWLAREAFLRGEYEIAHGWIARCTSARNPEEPHTAARARSPT